MPKSSKGMNSADWVSASVSGNSNSVPFLCSGFTASCTAFTFAKHRRRSSPLNPPLRLLCFTAAPEVTEQAMAISRSSESSTASTRCRSSNVQSRYAMRSA